MSEITAPPPIPASLPVPRSGVATASMVCGFLVIPTCFATVLPAIILGHIALSQSQRTTSVDPSRKAAKIGLIFGYGAIALIPIIAAVAGLLAPLVIRQRNMADQALLTNNTRQIGLALTEYEAGHGTVEEPYPADLAELQSLGLTTNLEELLSVRSVHAGDWIYFPSADSRSGAATLLISPSIGGKVAMLSVDMGVRLLPDQEAEEAVRSSSGPVRRIPAPIGR